MSESINNNVNNACKYSNNELKKYDTDGDGSLSLFEIENIKDEEAFQLLSEDIEKNQQTEEKFGEEDKETQISDLEAILDNAENSQGIIGKAWNRVKSATGIGSSTKKCEQAIEDFKNGIITYDEAYTKISEFSSKQEDSVNFAANMLSGMAAVLVVSSTVLTGGSLLPLGIIAGAAIGAGTKAGLKFANRATNEVKGDALDAKQIAKDSVSGAINGAVSIATVGMGSTAAITSETVASQTLKQTVIQGAKAGATEGAVSGAIMGASDYTIEAAFEDDVNFNIKDLAKSTATNAAGGAVVGGIMGGISSGIQYKKASSNIQNSTASNVDSPENIENAKVTDTDKTIETSEINNTSKASGSSSELEIEATAAKSSNAANEVNVANQTEVGNFSQAADSSPQLEIETTTAKSSNAANEVNIANQTEVSNFSQAADSSPQLEIEATTAKSSNAANEVNIANQTEVSNFSQAADSSPQLEIETTTAKSSNAANEVNIANQTEVSNFSQAADSSPQLEIEATTAKSSNAANEVKIPEKIEQELNKNAEDMNKLFESNIKEATEQIDNEFGTLSSVKENGITGRAKSQKSILAKLEKKFKDSKLKSTSKEACTDAIGDAYGTRIQLKSLSTERSKEIIEDCLFDSDITYEQFIKYMNGDTLNLDDASITALTEIKGTIIDLLKEEQTQEVVDQLVDAIGNGRLTITELNNYGDDISSYFTNTQLQEIADAYYIQTGEKLTLVTADDFSNGSGTKFDLYSSSDYTVDIDTSKAIKDSGYATSQMNTKQLLKNGTTGNGELQIRGSVLNEFADAEHIPYDIKSGKITDIDTKYSDVYGTIKSMIENKTYDSYNQYIVDTYQHLRLQELGIETVKPDITSYVKDLSEEAASLLNMEGLISISKRGH